jgi:uncharacterized protein
MRDKAFEPVRVDVTALAKSGALEQGDLGPASFPRLLESVQSMAGPASWSVRGVYKAAAGREPEIRLNLQVRAQAVQICQRCLEPMQLALAVERVLRFVRDAELAEQLDEETEDEDVLQLPRRLNLVELIEDELIMALPIVPRHEHCPAPPPMAYEDPAGTAAADDEAPPHPFAVLAALRAGKPRT